MTRTRASRTAAASRSSSPSREAARPRAPSQRTRRSEGCGGWQAHEVAQRGRVEGCDGAASLGNRPGTRPCDLPSARDSDSVASNLGWASARECPPRTRITRTTRPPRLGANRRSRTRAGAGRQPAPSDAEGRPGWIPCTRRPRTTGTTSVRSRYGSVLDRRGSRSRCDCPLGSRIRRMIESILATSF